MFASQFRCQPATLQRIQGKIIEETHKPQGCKHKEGGAGATSGCEIGHARVAAAAQGYGKGMGHQIGNGESKGQGLWEMRHGDTNGKPKQN